MAKFPAMTQPSKPSKNKSPKKDPRKSVHKATSTHHSASSHHAPSHDHREQDRRAHPRGDDILTKIQDATEKVLRARKHEVDK